MDVWKPRAPIKIPALIRRTPFLIKEAASPDILSRCMMAVMTDAGPAARRKKPKPNGHQAGRRRLHDTVSTARISLVGRPDDSLPGTSRGVIRGTKRKTNPNQNSRFRRAGQRFRAALQYKFATPRGTSLGHPVPLEGDRCGRIPVSGAIRRTSTARAATDGSIYDEAKVAGRASRLTNRGEKTTYDASDKPTRKSSAKTTRR